VEEARQYSAVTLWLTFLLAMMSATFGWAAYRGFAKGTTNLPLRFIQIEEFDRHSLYFWGVMGINILASLSLGGAAVLAYANDWGNMVW
jgi:hypothetical protein